MKTIPLSFVMIDQTSDLSSIFNKLNDNGLGFVLLHDHNNVLNSVLTDGDIRRALMDGASLAAKAFEISNKDFKYANSIDEARSLLINPSTAFVPILDKTGVLVDCVIKTNVDVRVAVIQAGGKGTRLLPLTANCPKPLVKLSDQFIIDYVFEVLLENDFNHIFVVGNYLHEQLFEYIRKYDSDYCKISCIAEKKYAGTASSLKLLGKIKSDNFLLINCDIITDANLKKMMETHVSINADLTVLSKTYKHTVPYGVLVEENGSLHRVDEKPVMAWNINAGVYVLKSKLLDLIPDDGWFDMPDLVNMALKKKLKCNTYPDNFFWKDVGTHEDLMVAEEWLSNKNG